MRASPQAWRLRLSPALPAPLLFLRAAIPVTLRKVSSIFTVISGHSGLSESEVSALEATLRAQGTVVLLMGVRTLPDTVASLLSWD